jgi:RNA polymerase sigma-70 factor, ECF subfamily
MPVTPDANTSTSELPLAARMAQLAAHSALVERLCSQADSGRFGISTTTLMAHLARSAASRFKTQTPSSQELEAYLNALCWEDLALACACSEGHEAAWDFFVKSYRGYLRRCAAVMLRRGADAPEARELADSLFAELYGLADGRRGAGSLLRYFHGRSSLKTWLRAVLAQRHVDGIRASRRFDSLDDGDGAGRLSAFDGSTEPRKNRSSGSAVVPSVGPLAIPPDPYREKYISLFCAALQGALRKLDAADHQRVRLYYGEGKTLAEVGRNCGEHESSVSRNLERIRSVLRTKVEEELRRGPRGDKAASDGASDGAGGGGLSDAQIALCFQYATEDTPIDLNLLFAGESLPSENSAQPDSPAPGGRRGNAPREGS